VPVTASSSSKPAEAASGTTPLSQAEPISLPRTSESPQLLRIRHSMSHVMAMAVQKLFP